MDEFEGLDRGRKRWQIEMSLYEDGSYYVEDESVEEYVPKHVHDLHTIPGSQTLIVVSNTKILDTLYCIDQNLQEYIVRVDIMESIMDMKRYPRSTGSLRSRGRVGDGRSRESRQGHHPKVGIQGLKPRCRTSFRH